MASASSAFQGAAPVGEAGEVEVAQHHGPGEQGRAGIGDALPRDVLGHVARALLKDGHRLAHIYAREQARSARQASHLRPRAMVLFGLHLIHSCVKSPGDA